MTNDEPSRLNHESEAQRLVRLTWIAMLTRQAGIPPRNAALTQPVVDGQWGVFLANMRPRIGTGFTVGLLGLRGPGKTQLGVELIQHAIHALQPARYCTATSFSAAVKASFKRSGPSESDVLDEFCAPTLLVIDEVGHRGDSDWEQRVFYELIDRRHREMRDTLLISNEELDVFCAALGPSISARMRETGGIKVCDWPSFRK